MSFTPETDILISTQRFAPNDVKRSDRFVVIKILNEDPDPHTIMKWYKHIIQDDNKKDIGVLIKITLFQKNNKTSQSDFSDVFKFIMRFLKG